MCEIYTQINTIMNYNIKKNNYFNTVGMVFNNHEAAFEGFPEIIEVKDLFLSKKSRIGELLSELNKPYTEVYGVKSDSRNQLRSALRLAIGTGITVAKKQKNVPLLNSLKRYKTSLSKTNTHDLPEMANRVYTELKQNETIAVGAGLTADKLEALHELSSTFREITESTDYEFSTRKAARKELTSLVSDCNTILKDEIDAYAGHCKDTFPGFYNAYTTARTPRKSRKKKSAVNPALCDISGTVTDGVSGLTLPNVTINLQGYDLSCTTDADGYYLFDELSAGNYTVTCHTTGYNVPENVNDEVAAGESVVIDFVLMPVVNPVSN